MKKTFFLILGFSFFLFCGEGVFIEAQEVNPDMQSVGAAEERDANITIHDFDPTPGKNLIVSAYGEVGHTWISLTINGVTTHYGWGYAKEASPVLIYGGETVSGTLMVGAKRNRLYEAIEKGAHNSYSVDITTETAKKIEAMVLAVGADSSSVAGNEGIGYSFEGSSGIPLEDGGMTPLMCSEMVTCILNEAFKLDSMIPFALVNNYPLWGDQMLPPSAIPSELKGLANNEKIKLLTTANPNAVASKIDQQNMMQTGEE